MGDPNYYFYINEVHTQEHQWPTWPPDKHLVVGDVGVFEGFVFQHRATLRDDFGVEFEVDADPAASTRKFATSNAVELKFKAAAEVDPNLFPHVPAGKAGVRIDFTKERAVVYAFLESRHDRMRSVNSIATQLAGHSGWRDNFFLVTEVVSAASGTVLIQQGGGTHVELSAEVDVAADIASLGRADAGFMRRSGFALMHETVAATGLTPLYVGGYVTGRHESNVGPLGTEGDLDAPGTAVSFRIITPEDAGVPAVSADS